MEKRIRMKNMEKRIRVNELPDELILKIFSLLPMFKETIAAHLISKASQCPWKLESDVKFDDDKSHASFVTFMSFVYGSLLFNNAQALERFHLELSRNYSASVINFLVKIAAYRYVRKLRINLHGLPLELPSCLSTCITLKSLILYELSIKVVPPLFSLPSLKSLHLFSVKFSSKECVASLLQSCPELEYLVIHQSKEKNVKIFNIDVPSLTSLTINNWRGIRASSEKKHGFTIKTPALRYLSFNDTFSNFLKFEYMPEVIKANIKVICDQSEKFLGSLTSIQHLSLCSQSSKTPYPRGTFFFFLEHLELCICSARWLDLLACILNDAPRLRSIKLKWIHCGRYDDLMNKWNEPKVVPECLSKHLEIFEWRQLEGTKQQMNVAAYILANATCLKKATFSSTRSRDTYHDIINKLKEMKRVSKTCQLVFE